MRLRHTILISLLLLAGPLAAHAQIGLLLDAQANVDRDFGAAITGEGHSAVYLARVCPSGPVQLRLCAPRELGSVIQNYKDYKEDAPYEWNAVPLSVYLYGVDDPQQKPLFASPELRRILQEQYRRRYLQDVCASDKCIRDPAANWRDSVAAAFVREIYIFQVNTTEAQDEQFIRQFNARANVGHYSGFRNNCADFAKLVVNTYFPHSAHRNVLNDLGMTGPKAIARSFAHYAERHPELEFRVVRVEQVPGTYSRSSDSHEGTEQMLRAKKWLVPMAVLGYHAMPVLAASYLLTGRFNPDHELRAHPSGKTAALNDELLTADESQRQQIETELQAERERQLGTPEQWERYRERFDEVLRTAVADGVIADRRALHNLFRELETRGRFYLDNDQQPWMEVESGGQVRHVGLSAGTVLAPESDRRLALQLLLSRTEDLLSAKPKHRELYPEFQTDWALLQQAEQAMATPATHGIIAERR